MDDFNFLYWLNFQPFHLAFFLFTKKIFNCKFAYSFSQERFYVLHILLDCYKQTSAYY